MVGRGKNTAERIEKHVGVVEEIELAEAVTSLRAGDVVYIGNFGAPLHLVGHELIRQHRRDLHIVMGSGGILLDALIGTGVAAQATFAHCWGPIGPVPAWNLRRSVEQEGGAERIHELSLGAMHAALLAGAWGVPFMPVAGLDDTGYVQDWASESFTRVDSPFGEATVVAALVPDIAFIHADVVDRRGNAVIRTPFGESIVAAQASRRTVIVAEEIHPAGSDSTRSAELPGALVSAIVELPGAVRPDGVAHRYPRDVEAYKAYGEASRTPEGFAAWVDEVVHV